MSVAAVHAREPHSTDAATPPTGRMAIALLALAGTLLATYLLMHRLGLIGSLACGPGGQCERVQASPWATFLGVPVPLIGVCGYLALLVVSLLGLRPDLERDRRIGGALLGMATLGLLFSAYLTWAEAARIHAWCRWCLGSAAIATLIFLFALTEIPRMSRNVPAAGEDA